VMLRRVQTRRVMAANGENRHHEKYQNKTFHQQYEQPPRGFASEEQMIAKEHFPVETVPVLHTDNLKLRQLD